MRPLLFILTLIWCLTAHGYNSGDLECPQPNALNRYVEVALIPDLNSTTARENFPELSLHEDLQRRSLNKKIKVYFELTKPYDASQDILFLIPGGPGQDHQILHGLHGEDSDTSFDNFNVVAMDYRGLGCSRPVFPGDMPIQSYLMRFAAHDIEAIRLSLGGPQAKIHLFGMSFGSLLGQTYALLYPSHLKNIFLVSSASSYQDLMEADEHYESLLLDWDPKLRSLFERLRNLSDKVAHQFLNWSTSRMYTYSGRTKEVPRMLGEIVDLVTQNEISNAQLRLETGHGVMPPMQRAIMCQELTPPRPQDGRFHLNQGLGCEEFEGAYDYFDYTHALKNISARTFLWSGRFDPVTSRAAMDKMAQRIPNHFYFRDQHSGHGPEKPECLMHMMKSFFANSPNRKLQKIARSADCTSPPSTANE